jgi:hypothetical protein
MPAPELRLLSFRGCARLLTVLAALAPTMLSVGGCSVVIDGQLSEKHDETRGDGGQDVDGGHDGGLAASNTSSSSSGGLVCPSDFADCDGIATNGCEAHVKDDPKHCGGCNHHCQPGEKCAGGACK